MRRPHGACGRSSPAPAAALLLAAAAICAQFAAGFQQQVSKGMEFGTAGQCRKDKKTTPTRLAGDPQTSKDDKKAEAQSEGHTGQTVLFVLLGVGAAILFSFFLFKYWQKKKREEQHARLLKLFEEDDDIEVELGLRY